MEDIEEHLAIQLADCLSSGPSVQLKSKLRGFVGGTSLRLQLVLGGGEEVLATSPDVFGDQPWHLSLQQAADERFKPVGVQSAPGAATPPLLLARYTMT